MLPETSHPFELGSAFFSRWATAIVLAVLLLHLAIILTGGTVAKPASYTLLVVMPLVAAICCMWRAGAGPFAEGWRAMAFAMVLWAAGMAANMSVELLAVDPGRVPGISMVLYVLYGVPLIVVIASPAGEPWHVRLVDGGLALVLAVLFCAHTFAFASLISASEEGVTAIRWMFDIENAYIAFFATIRWRAAEDRSTREFFGKLAGFAWIYGLVAAGINHFAAETDFGSPADIAIGLPFLWLMWAALRIRPVRQPAASETLQLAMRAGSPFLLPASLVIVAATLYFRAPFFALLGFVSALLGYGLRSILVQMRSMAEQSRLDRDARSDGLTGLANRREFDHALVREWNRARRSGAELAVLLVDIDHFKMLNDGLGHQAGDERLRAVATLLNSCVTRGNDLVARYGGEEFVAVLPDTGEAAAWQLAETMRHTVELEAMKTPAPGGTVTVSIGICAGATDGGYTAHDMVAAADAALYRAKEAGRNRVMCGSAGAVANR